MCPNIILRTRIDVKIGTEITEANDKGCTFPPGYMIIKLKTKGCLFFEFLLSHHL